MSPAFLRAFRVKKSSIAVLAALVFLLVFLSFCIIRAAEIRAGRHPAEALSAAAAKKVVVVDPGHGGFDPGAVGKSGVQEKDVNLEVARRLAAYLGQAGAMVVMTREADNDLSSPGAAGLVAKMREDLEARVALANEKKADLYVSIHAGSYPSPERCGARTFVQRGSAESMKAARFIQAELARAVKGSGLYTGEVDYYITRSVLMPAVVVETGFMSNEREEKLLADPAYQDKLAWAVYTGVAKYFAEQAASPQESPEKEKIIKTFKEQPNLKTFRP